MNIQIFGTKKSSDTRKAERWFKERRVKAQVIDLLDKGISKGELRSVAQACGGVDALLDENARDQDALALVKYTAAAQKEDAGFWHDAETLFAWNRWGRNSGSSGDDAGIGPFFNHAAASGSRSDTADYTFSADAGAAGNMYEKTGASAYSVRRLEIWVVQKPNGARIMIR